MPARSVLQRLIDVGCRVSDAQSAWANRISGRRCGLTDFRTRILPGVLRPGLRVLDVGGGRCPAIDVWTKQRLNLHVVGLDISATELALAPEGAYDRCLVGDVTTAELADEFDLVFSITVLEHVRDVPAALANMARALTAGGTMLHFLPCRHAPFAVLNRLLGNRLARWLLHLLYPFARGRTGFEAFYDECVPSRMAGHLAHLGFERIATTPYYLSEYLRFFPPAHALELLRQLAVMRLGASDFAESFAIVAESPRAVEARLRLAA